MSGHYDNERSAPPRSPRPHPHQHPRLRRNPLSGAINTLVLLDIPPKPSSHENMSSPLPRQNARIQPPSPPQVIQDKTGSLRYQRISSLGEVRSAYLGLIWSLHTLTSQGGFAGVYQVRDSRNTYLACKVVSKSSLKTKKAKTKVHTHCMQAILDAETISALRRDQNSQGARPSQHRSIHRLFRG